MKGPHGVMFERRFAWWPMLLDTYDVVWLQWYAVRHGVIGSLGEAEYRKLDDPMVVTIGVR